MRRYTTFALLQGISAEPAVHVPAFDLSFGRLTFSRAAADSRSHRRILGWD